MVGEGLLNARPLLRPGGNGLGKRRRTTQCRVVGDFLEGSACNYDPGLRKVALSRVYRAAHRSLLWRAVEHAFAFCL